MKKWTEFFDFLSDYRCGSNEGDRPFFGFFVCLFFLKSHSLETHPSCSSYSYLFLDIQKKCLPQKRSLSRRLGLHLEQKKPYRRFDPTLTGMTADDEDYFLASVHASPCQSVYLSVALFVKVFCDFINILLLLPNSRQLNKSNVDNVEHSVLQEKLNFCFLGKPRHSEHILDKGIT